MKSNKKIAFYLFYPVGKDANYITYGNNYPLNSLS